jgi:Ca2+-binding RTX toxin-like protein
MIRPLLGALALLALAAPAASASDAEIFATNNTAVITDPADPRLKDELKGFARQVERIIDDGGGAPRGSELLDGVFSDGTTTTFERSRRFDVDRVSEDELHTIADTIRARFAQQSVLTFDRLPPGSEDVDGVLLDVPRVTADALRRGLLDDAQARERLFGGSVTQDRHLLLVAALEDAGLARAFAKAIGGDVKRAKVEYGKREFVEAPLPVRVAGSTLVVSGTAGDDAIVLTTRPGRIEVTLDGKVFAFAARKVDRIRIDAGDGNDTLATEGASALAAGDHVRVGDTDIDGVEILRLTGSDVLVGDLSATDTFQVDAKAPKLRVLGSEDDDQISVSPFGVLGPTFVRPEGVQDLTVEGRGGDDILGASTATGDVTLVGGSGDNVLIGGPGNDHLIGGPGFDDVSGGKGADVALMGGDFDRFTWKAGDGSDVVDGGGSRDSLSYSGTNDGVAYALEADGRGSRLTGGGDVLALTGIEEIDPVLGAGADTFAIGDLSRSGVELVDVSLANLPITPLGDLFPDRVTVAGTTKPDAFKLTGTRLTGLPWTVNLSHAESIDTLAISGGAGKDTLDAPPQPAIGVAFSD